MNTSTFDWLAILLTAIGAITWGLLGVTGLSGEAVNVINAILEPIFRPGPAQTVEYLIYTLVGIAGVYLLFTAYKMGRASRRATRERRKRDATTRTDATTRADATTDYDTDADNTES